MIVIPAVDIMDGRAVRLRQGRPDHILCVSDTPLSAAKLWESQGAGLIHVVDISGALGGQTSSHWIKTIIENVKTQIQLAGGIRDLSTATKWLDSGVYRVVLGTMAVEDPSSVCSLIESYGPDRVAVALDYDGNRLCTHGWRRTTDSDVRDFVESMRELGVQILIATSVRNDGMLCGPDLKTLASVRESGVDRLIASGGVSCLADLVRLREIGVEGVIVGRALYERRFSFDEAREVAAGGG